MATDENMDLLPTWEPGTTPIPQWMVEWARSQVESALREMVLNGMEIGFSPGDSGEPTIEVVFTNWDITDGEGLEDYMRVAVSLEEATERWWGEDRNTLADVLEALAARLRAGELPNS